MSTTCAVCMAIGRSVPGPLLPIVVTYQGYSLCVEHLHFWEANRELNWSEIVTLAQSPVVVKVDLSDADTDEEKMEKLKEAKAEFDDIIHPKSESITVDEPQVMMYNAGGLGPQPDMTVLDIPPPDFVGDTEAVTQHDPEAIREIELDAEERASVKAAEADGTAPWLEEKKSEFKSKRRRRAKTYFCTKCNQKHSRKSNIGKKHEEFSS